MGWGWGSLPEICYIVSGSFTNALLAILPGERAKAVPPQLLQGPEW